MIGHSCQGGRRGGTDMLRLTDSVSGCCMWSELLLPRNMPHGVWAIWCVSEGRAVSSPYWYRMEVSRCHRGFLIKWLSSKRRRQCVRAAQTHTLLTKALFLWDVNRKKWNNTHDKHNEDDLTNVISRHLPKRFIIKTCVFNVKGYFGGISYG